MADPTLGEEFYVERVIGKRTTVKGVEYLIKWRDYTADYNTWEPEKNLSCDELVAKYEANSRHGPWSETDKETETESETGAEEEAKEMKEAKEEKVASTKAAKKRKISNNDEKKEQGPVDDNESFKPWSSFDMGLIPERIVGVGELPPETFYVKWKDCDGLELVPAHLCNVRMPQTVIRFYESITEWRDPLPEDTLE